MIALLKGTLVEKGPGHVLVDTGGVGYEVSVPTSLSERLPEAGAQICLRTHMEASEGLPELFGFADRDELEVFRALIRVSRVGPRLALKVLSGLTPAEVVGAVTRRDAAAFRSVPGVGDETAQRLLVEMARLVKKLVLTVRPENATRADLSGLTLHVKQALASLGYKSHEIDRAVSFALDGLEGEPTLELLVKRALAYFQEGTR